MLKRSFLVCLFAFMITLAVFHPAQASDLPDPATSRATVLCMPGIYMDDPGDCLPFGPSDYLTGLARQGITLPTRPLSAQSINPILMEVPYSYARLKHEPTPIYASLDDAVAGAAPMGYFEAGDHNHISYINSAQTARGWFFQLKSGGWVQVETRVGIPRTFQGGLLFQRTPLNQFGWILRADTQAKRTPGFGRNDYTDRVFSPYEVVQVYSVEQVGDMQWYRIGPDEWVDERMVARVYPAFSPPEGVENGRWIEVNLYEQTLSVYENNRLVFATVIASGAPPMHTQPGLFPIYEKLESTPMSGAFNADRSDYYYLDDVPWTMYYDDARALHGAYWRSRLGYKQSAGCVNLTVGDSRWLFDWAELGDWVYVWDPSGETPTDPSFYSSGGA